MSSQRFKHESLQDTKSVVQYLEALGQGFEAGKLALISEDRSMELHPRGLVRLEVEAKRKDEEIKLSIKLRWTEEEHAAQVDAGSLTISSKDAG